MVVGGVVVVGAAVVAGGAEVVGAADVVGAAVVAGPADEVGAAEVAAPPRLGRVRAARCIRFIGYCQGWLLKGMVTVRDCNRKGWFKSGLVT